MTCVSSYQSIAAPIRVYKTIGGRSGDGVVYPQQRKPPMGKLTAAAVQAARHPSTSERPVRFGDGDGLYLQVAPGSAVAPGGTKSWLFRYTLRGKAREMGLGPYGEPR